MIRIAFLIVLALSTSASAQVLPGRPGTKPHLIIEGPTKETLAKLKQLREEERLRRESAKPPGYIGDEHGGSYPSRAIYPWQEGGCKRRKHKRRRAEVYQHSDKTWDGIIKSLPLGPLPFGG